MLAKCISNHKSKKKFLRNIGDEDHSNAVTGFLTRKCAFMPSLKSPSQVNGVLSTEVAPQQVLETEQEVKALLEKGAIEYVPHSNRETGCNLV